MSAPIPAQGLAEFKAYLREDLKKLDAEGRLRVAEDQPDVVCRVAADLATLYRWADASTVANALVDVLGAGWGATYLHWLHELSCTCPKGWVSYSEVGPHPSPGCPVHGEVAA